MSASDQNQHTTQSTLWIKTGYGFLVIAMIMGAFLRMSFFYRPFDFNYKFVLHGHSHVILLGWVFNALCGFLIWQYREINTALTRTLFWLFQITVIGMMITFPVQGYAFWSIIFSSAHILLSFVFVVHFWKKTKGNKSLTLRMVRLGLLFLCVSTLGPLSLGPIVVNGLAGTPIYDLAIYFYLHFMYNGFFVLVLIAILLNYFKDQEIAYSRVEAVRIYYLIGFTAIPAFVLSALGFFPMEILYGLGLATAFMQLSGVYYWMKITLSKNAIKHFSGLKILYLTGVLSLAGKFVFQLISAIPQLRTQVFENHGYIITYLHLVFIGFITCSLIVLMIKKRILLAPKSLVTIGSILLLVGFIFTEVLIAAPHFSGLFGLSPFVAIFTFSLVILAGISVFSLKSKKS